MQKMQLNGNARSLEKTELKECSHNKTETILRTANPHFIDTKQTDTADSIAYIFPSFIKKSVLCPGLQK